MFIQIVILNFYSTENFYLQLPAHSVEITVNLISCIFGKNFVKVANSLNAMIY